MSVDSRLDSILERKLLQTGRRYHDQRQGVSSGCMPLMTLGREDIGHSDMTGSASRKSRKDTPRLTPERWAE